MINESVAAKGLRGEKGVEKVVLDLPAFAESPARNGGDECEKVIHRSLGGGGSASAGFAENVKMPREGAR